jgi:hypothetical protein
MSTKPARQRPRFFRAALFAVAGITGVLLAVLLLPRAGLFETAPEIVAQDAGSAAGALITADVDIAGTGKASTGTQEALDDMPPQMRRQLADVAQAYAESARFPNYATPLQETDWAQLNPRAFVPRAAALQNVVGVTATVVLAQYVVDRGSELPVQVQVFAGPDAEGVAATAVRVSLQRRGQGSVWQPLAVAPGGRPAEQHFAGVLPATALAAVPEGEAAVVAEVDFSNGERALVTAAVKLFDSVARLLAVGDARIEGADLLIPARFDVRKAGTYRVAANLFAARGDVPVSHLNAELRLESGPDDGVLKVHAVTLREKGEAGPYLLRDIDVTRIPDQPGEPTRYGTAAAESFAVRGYPLDAYSNEPWEDPAARQRLEFLQKLSGEK